MQSSIMDKERIQKRSYNLSLFLFTDYKVGGMGGGDEFCS